MPVSSVSATQCHRQYNGLPSETASKPIPKQSAARNWGSAFIPTASSSWEGKPMCIDEFDENPNCCASGYDIEAIVQQAYEDGLQDHPGVKALDKHPRPCVTSADLETLADELANMCNPQESGANPSPIPGVPENLNPQARTDTIFDTKILDYCADLVNRVVTASYGGQAEVPEKTTLGQKFDEVFKFCAHAITDRISIIDLLRNTFMHKTQQIRSPFLPLTTRGLEDREGPWLPPSNS